MYILQLICNTHYEIYYNTNIIHYIIFVLKKKGGGDGNCAIYNITQQKITIYFICVCVDNRSISFTLPIAQRAMLKTNSFTRTTLNDRERATIQTVGKNYILSSSIIIYIILTVPLARPHTAIVRLKNK